jgi:predicted short-subunit dehydrogenase-like oxidoreductase (DUF2520 family)
MVPEASSVFPYVAFHGAISAGIHPTLKFADKEANLSHQDDPFHCSATKVVCKR